MQIREIHLLTDDLEGTEEFYNGKLGTAISVKNEKSISFVMGGTKLLFIKSEGVKPYYHFAFDIPNNQLQEALAWIEKKIPILSVTESSAITDFRAWNAKSFYFYDNNGNIVEFICRFDEDNQSSKPFSGSSILFVSEIGIVSPDVPRLANNIIERYGLEIFKKQPRENGFTVIGNDTGLLILSINERNWYPTDKKAKCFYTKIKFENNGKMHEMEIS
jgi:catechol 2,3-dioxygenase-like lactoylglutathione lyase family enzyme